MTGMQNMGDKCEYVVINVSSPNTPGLRDLQTTQHLKTIITSVQQARKRLADGRVPPRILLKVSIGRVRICYISVQISPDLNTADMKEIANVCMKLSIDGVIIGNTTLERPSFLTSEHKIESGGLSGAPLRTLTRSKIHEFYTLTKGRITIVGCGGVSNGRDAYEHIRAGEVDKCPGCECAPVCAGASAVQLYTAIVYQGWPVFARVKRELHECLLNDGFTNVSQAVGADHRKK
jgi:dihydroorotate dehydrogenase